jgi:hypothetical protein
MLTQLLLESHSIHLLEDRYTHGSGNGSESGSGFGHGRGRGSGFGYGSGAGFSTGNGNGSGFGSGKYGKENALRPLIWEVFMNTKDQTTYVVEE